MARPRSICFTLNNYTQVEYDHIKNGSFKYLIVQQEVGAGGTPHLQGYATMHNPTVFSTWKRLVGERAHIEVAKGNAQQNRAYCTKPECRVPGTEPFELGQIPEAGERTDLTKLVEAAKDVSKSITDIIEIDGVNFLRYYKGVERIRSAYAGERDFKTIVCWCFGSTGTGKTRTIRESARGAYWKQNSPWWCGYDPSSHHTVVIDEYRCDFSKFSFLLQLFDRYPLSVQSKGGNCNFRARKIFVSSPKSPNETWATRTEEDVQQLLRRIEGIVEFLPGGFRRFIKGDESIFAGDDSIVHDDSSLSVIERTCFVSNAPQAHEEAMQRSVGEDESSEA